MELKRIEKSGFTLLEIIIVIIIFGIMAGLAFPRYIALAEFSRSREAISHLTSIRSSMNRCYLYDNAFTNCSTFGDLDVENPTADANSLFSYSIAVGANTFLLTAQRNSSDGGDGTSLVTLNQDGTIGGTGAFSNIR